LPVVLGNFCWLLGAVLLVNLLFVAWIRMVKRWRRNMDVSDDPEYVATLATLSEASVRRHFNPYTDIDWEAPELSVRKNDPRWVLSATDPVGRHPWYQAQTLEKQIEIGLWRHANTAKVSLQLESILIRGLMNYTFWVPNGSPEYRYCVHESIEECNHATMFQELVNRIGVDAPGMPRWLRWISPAIPLYAGPLPGTFFFGVLAGELPIHNMQKTLLREGNSLHPIMEKVMAIHVAEEARHISFADQFLKSGYHIWCGGAGLRYRYTCRSLCVSWAKPSSCRRAAFSESSTYHGRFARNCSSMHPARVGSCVTCTATCASCATTWA
jgi:hypothetical protein